MIVTTLLEEIFVYIYVKIDCFIQTTELFGLFDADSVVDMFAVF